MQENSAHPDGNSALSRSPKAGKLASSGLYLIAASALLAALIAFYANFYSPHQDLAGTALSAQLAFALGDRFEEYSLYFPPAEHVWFGLSVQLSNFTGLRLDLSVITLTGIAVLFSTTLAYKIRKQTVGATPLFLAGSIAALVILPILYKNMFGLREHMVALGLWPYLVLRFSDPDGDKIGWKMRGLVGIWLGATLTLKYLYSIVVLLIELGDAALRRSPISLFRFENLVAGSIVALYLLFWLVLDPGQREVIGIVARAIDANLASTQTNFERSAIHFSLALFFLLLAYIYKLPARISAIGLAMVIGAIAASWVQSRWYSHHLFPITLAYVAWLWMFHRHVRILWLVAVSLLFVRPIVGEYAATSPYQRSVNELEAAMDDAGISVAGKRVGLLNMHPSPFNQYLAAHDGVRWISSMNNSYVAANLQSLDVPENAGMKAPAVSIDDPGIALLQDKMLRLWEDRPPELLILDESTSWPLQHVEVEWRRVFAEDERLQAILSQYRPVHVHSGDMLDFTVYERVDTDNAD